MTVGREGRSRVSPMAVRYLATLVGICLLAGVAFALGRSPEEPLPVAAGPAHPPVGSFVHENEEWTYFLATDRAGRVTGGSVGSDAEEGGTSTARDSLAASVGGFGTYVFDYEVRESYAYAAFHKEGRLEPVQAYALGSHRYFSFFVRGEPGLYLEISLRDLEGGQSLWALTLPDEVNRSGWTNLKLEVADLRPGQGREPAREVRTIVVAVVRREWETRPLDGRLELGFLSFTDDPRRLGALPALTPGELPRSRALHALTGPATPTPLPLDAPPATPTTRYERGAPYGLALWVHDEDGDWLGLAHGLKALGVPFRVVRSLTEASRHRAVLVHPAVTGLGEGELAGLEAFVEAGGTVIAHLDGPASTLRPGGVLAAGAEAPSAPTRLRFEPSSGPHQAFLRDEAEVRIPIRDLARDELLGPAVGLVHERAEAVVVARYEPGGEVAALALEGSGGGKLYLWGVDMGGLLLRAQNDGSVGAAEHYVNHYHPANDLFLRFLRGALEETAPASAVRLRTAPDGYDVAVLLTHDDPLTDVEVTARFAASERQRGVDATYFVFPKYNVPEFDDDAYLFHSAGGRPKTEWLREVAVGLGHDLESHGVSHPPDFDEPLHWPMGSGDEAFESYYPHFVCEAPPPESDCEDYPRVRRCQPPEGGCGLVRTVGGSLLGELRVSRRLVEHLSPRPVTAFRPGFLFWPRQLNEALAATGYRYTSIATCNTHLTHLPYQLNHGKGRSELDLYEFCLSSDDQAAPLSDRDGAGGRLHQATDLVHRLARYGGVFVQLIHPDDTWSTWQDNLRFQEALIDRLRSVQGLAHFTTVRRFGEFWRARDHVTVNVEGAGPGSWRLEIDAPEPVEGLSLDVPSAWLRIVEPGPRASLDAGRNVLVVHDRIEGRVTLFVEERGAAGGQGTAGGAP